MLDQLVGLPDKLEFGVRSQAIVVWAHFEVLGAIRKVVAEIAGDAVAERDRYVILFLEERLNLLWKECQ